MNDIKPKFTEKILYCVAALAFCVILSGCSVSVKDHNNGGNSKVDIETPFGGIHVNEDVDVHDTGLVVYPGARKKAKSDDDDEKSANVNISSSWFGLKVVAAEFESDDAPGKIVPYYKDQLKKFGSVLECHTSRHVGDFDPMQGDITDKDGHPRPLSCDSDDNGHAIELKVGTEQNQHIVFVEPEGKGSDFALAYIVMRGKQGSI